MPAAAAKGRLGRAAKKPSPSRSCSRGFLLILWVECGVRVSPAVAGGAILPAFEQVLEEFAAGGFSPLREEYAACCINLGREVRVVTPAGEQTGFAYGIGEDGCLLVKAPAGELAIRSGEASVRGVYGYV